MWVVSGIICFAVSLSLGAYRQYCNAMEVKARYMMPPIWRSLAVQITSWFIVALASLWFAFVGSIMIGAITYKLLGNFSFGVLLLLRWVFSSMIGITKANQHVAEFDEFNYLEEGQRILAEGEEMKQEYIEKKR